VVDDPLHTLVDAAVRDILLTVTTTAVSVSLTAPVITIQV